MAQKKDSKGRNLQTGEDQMPDGRYRFRYNDKFGNRKAIYAWKLVPTDKTPKGKAEKPSLREQIKEIEKAMADGIHTTLGDMTVGQLISRYLNLNTTITLSTRNGYLSKLDNINNSFLGKMKIRDVKKSTIQEFYNYLMVETEVSVSTVLIYQSLMHPAFQLAVDDEILRINPCTGARSALKINREEKKALSKAEQQNLLSFLKETNSSMYPIILFMLGTGTRVSEALAITWHDIDFKNNLITIDHQIKYDKIDGHYQLVASPTKTKNIRVIPMQETLAKFLREYKKENYFRSHNSNLQYGEYKDFVFLNGSTKPNIYHSANIKGCCYKITKDYNKKELERAKTEGRPPELMPRISPHLFRHTYCTRMAERSVDAKVLQCIMGHSSIITTMNVYNHVNEDRIMAEIKKVEDVLHTKIS